MRVSDTVPREAATVFVLKRLRFAGSKPMGIQTAYVPLELVKGLCRAVLKYDIFGSNADLLH